MRVAERAEEDNYDAAAAQEEAVRERVNAGGGLHASLRNCYWQKQAQQGAPKTQGGAGQNQDTNDASAAATTAAVPTKAKQSDSSVKK